MAEEDRGGCGCGAVRYRLASTPWDAGWCHCRTCQLSSGSPAMAFATVPVADYVIEQGDQCIASFKSSETGVRRFCSGCGTPLTMQVAHQPDTIDFTIVTLDAPNRVSPRFHIFYADRIPWAEAANDLPRHDRFRPNTRGLAEL